MKNNTKQTAEQAGAQCLRDSIHTLFFFQKYSVKQFLTLYSLSILSPGVWTESFHPVLFDK